MNNLWVELKFLYRGKANVNWFFLWVLCAVHTVWSMDNDVFEKNKNKGTNVFPAYSLRVKKAVHVVGQVTKTIAPFLLPSLVLGQENDTATQSLTQSDVITVGVVGAVLGLFSIAMSWRTIYDYCESRKKRTDNTSIKVVPL